MFWRTSQGIAVGERKLGLYLTDMVTHTGNLVLRRLRQEDCRFEASLSHIVRSCVRNQSGWGGENGLICSSVN